MDDGSMDDGGMDDGGWILILDSREYFILEEKITDD